MITSAYSHLLLSAAHTTPCIVESLHDTHLAAPSLEQLQTGSVVIEGDVGPVHTLAFVLVLLELEEVAVEVPL